MYTFDDHDFGNNNADGLSSSADPANMAYKVWVGDAVAFLMVFFRKWYPTTNYKAATPREVFNNALL